MICIRNENAQKNICLSGNTSFTPNSKQPENYPVVGLQKTNCISFNVFLGNEVGYTNVLGRFQRNFNSSYSAYNEVEFSH
jgi:hypothetical protein